jgi:hypothetical protein
MTNIAEAKPPREYALDPAGERVNARLDGLTSRELKQLMRDTGLSVSDVIRESIHRFYLQAALQQRPIADAFADLIGGIEAAPNLSTDYKSELRDSLARKLE